MPLPRDLHKDEWWGQPVSLDFIFELQEAIERDPYPEVEYPSRRAYLFARAG